MHPFAAAECQNACKLHVKDSSVHWMLLLCWLLWSYLLSSMLVATIITRAEDRSIARMMPHFLLVYKLYLMFRQYAIWKVIAILMDQFEFVASRAQKLPSEFVGNALSE